MLQDVVQIIFGEEACSAPGYWGKRENGEKRGINVEVPRSFPVFGVSQEMYWERLQRGDYDWSHIAMRYWPERVREACTANKSFAIAHGHEEWYGG